LRAGVAHAGRFRCLAPDEAAAIQGAALGRGDDPDWLFEQSRRIAEALAKGEIALAQIYGLRIPLDELDDAALCKLAAAARLSKAGFDPNEPRVPAGNPDGGQWTYEPGYAKPRTHGHGSGADNEGGNTGSAASAGSSGSDGNEPSSGAGGNDSPQIPAERPDTARERNSIVRRTAEWLRQAAALGATFAPEPRVKAFFFALEATAWVVEYLPQIRSYLDAPKSLEELRSGVDDSQVGYQIHHIVEGQYGSISEESNARRFGHRLEARENLVRIPKWKHVLISSWYSTSNEAYGYTTPRKHLRGKSWDDQYDVGLRVLRRFGVL
jgi:hypothetical protein